MTILLLPALLGLAPFQVACSPAESGEAVHGPAPYRAGGPRVLPRKPTLRGSMPADRARTAIRKHLGSLQACYRRELGKRPALSLEITARIVVGADGKVKHVRLESSPEEEPDLERCLRDAITRVRFPSTCAGMTVIDQPFRFRPPRRPPEPAPEPPATREKPAEPAGKLTAPVA